jgi:hypothetical protein
MHGVSDSAGLRRTRASARHIDAFQFLSHRRLIPDVGRFQSSIPSLHIPLSTLRLRSCGRPRMTRGQDGSLLLILYDSFIHYSLPVYPDAHEESTMPDNPSTDHENETPYPDEEDWQIAFEPFQGHPYAALQLGFHLTEMKRLIDGLEKREAIAALDRAIDCLYEHSDFRSVSRDLFLTAIQGKLTPDTEELIRHLGIRI